MNSTAAAPVWSCCSASASCWARYEPYAHAISGIAIVGAIISTQSSNEIAQYLGLVAVIFATINVVGGFMVTDRMLKMFKKK